VEHSFWTDRWHRGQISFHTGAVHPHLVAHAAKLAPGPARVLVPLCGKSLDLLWLRDQGHQVVGVEFVEQAARAFFEENRLQVVPGQLGPHPTLGAAGITILIDDFLGLDPAVVGLFSAVWDRAALIALPAEVRASYLRKLRELVSDDARVLLVAFEHDLPHQGPPFSVPADEVRRLCQGLFAPELLEEVDTLAQEPRFRDRGATFIRDHVFLLRPLRPGKESR
jgi:thiopurine S-methyltransferase